MCNELCAYMASLRGLVLFLLVGICCGGFSTLIGDGLPLYYWQQPTFVNFGDYLSIKIVERMVEQPVRTYQRKQPEKKLLGLGSILVFAREGDVIWGTGTNGKELRREAYDFKNLDVRAVRGPLTRAFLKNIFDIDCPEVYGDPALLMPYLFPEFRRSENPTHDYIIIPHYADIKYFSLDGFEHVIYSIQPWDTVVRHILDAKFVISSSLHGIIVAEAYGIPARMLRLSEHEPLIKYQDYYIGTGRPDFQYATSVEEAMSMGGEPPPICDLQALYDAFPFEFWPNVTFKPLTFDNML